MLTAVLLKGAAILAMVLASASAQAQQSACPSSRTPIKLSFNTRAPQPIYNHRLTLAGIAREARAQSAAIGDGSRPVGLTAVNTFAGVEGGTSIRRNGDSYCSSLTSVQVDFGWDRMEVFVPSEYAVGSCEYRAVIDHENQHVAIIRTALREFAPKARAQVEAYLAQVKPISGRGREPSAEAVLAPIQAQLSALLRQFNELHSARSAHIDSPSNYAAVTALCKNWDGANAR